ncbi:pyridoxamine 5'-phosphate oxidase [Durotheca rogersii]|uniref:pyridoxamine 5'-phosphate oxidase n=1 Tax=Durotheca rogersii TaxID=419775 RepID=UPI00221EAFE3|nr:pyridoxamine 5'-phosphate oxidase [Durotheca rogersii]KAI5867499.1 pyridoxamine 5'-phosphate oxidase [Durotheca rogersii]
MDQATLNYEASAGDTHKQIVSSLPPDVVQCLENARFYSSAPVIVMTTNPSSKKTNNLVVNPNVSLLVHDWVSHRPPTQGRRLSGGSPGPENRSSLASLLLNLNTSAISSISATINGTAELVARGSDEEAFYRDQHLENNTFDSEGGVMFNGHAGSGQEDGGRECFVAGEEVRVILVHIKDIRTSDWKGGVKDWVLVPDSNSATPVNGIR